VNERAQQGHRYADARGRDYIATGPADQSTGLVPVLPIEPDSLLGIGPATRVHILALVQAPMRYFGNEVPTW
jgi:hypothetical protein